MLCTFQVPDSVLCPSVLFLFASMHVSPAGLVGFGPDTAIYLFLLVHCLHTRVTSFF